MFKSSLLLESVLGVALSSPKMNDLNNLTPKIKVTYIAYWENAFKILDSSSYQNTK